MTATVVLFGLGPLWASIIGEIEVTEIKTKKELVQVCVEVSAFQRVTP